MKRKIPHWLPHYACTRPDSIALEFKDEQWTYQRLYAEVQAIVSGFRRKGIDHGTRVAVLSSNHPMQIKVYHALMLLGAIIVPVNYKLTREETRERVDNAGCQYLCYHPAFESSIPPDIIPGEIISFEECASFGQPDPEMGSAQPEITLGDICTLFYTSGTTGQPKGVMLTYQNFLMSAMASALNMGLLPPDNWLACLPLDHIGGFSIVVRSVIYGTTVTLLEQFDTEVVIKNLAERRVTLISLVPTMLERLLSQRKSISHNLRAVLLGGGPADPDLIERSRRSEMPVLRSYGLTETCSQIATTPLQNAGSPPEASGRVLPFSTLKILNDKGVECPPGITGEITVSGPTVMEGYWRNPTATNSTIIQGWLHTGDHGYLDEEDFLYVVSRREDLIVTGGENVSPAEVETVLQQIPGIQEVCVVGIPDAHWGEAVSAAVVLKPGAALSLQTLRHMRHDQLAAYKHPKHYILLESIPRTAMGKPERFKVRQLIADSMR
ncbi:MAG: o-succinylbenzoate--CoA ligase [Calditrichota bacterium]